MMMRGEVLASVALVICSTQIYMGQTEDQSKLCLHLRLFLRFTCLAKEKKSLGWNAGKPGCVSLVIRWQASPAPGGFYSRHRYAWDRWKICRQSREKKMHRI